MPYKLKECPCSYTDIVQKCKAARARLSKPDPAGQINRLHLKLAEMSILLETCGEQKQNGQLRYACLQCCQTELTEVILALEEQIQARPDERYNLMIRRVG